MKTNEQLIQEFLDKGGEIEKLDYVDPETKQTIGSTTKKVPQIMTLAEGADMYGEKQKRRKTTKKSILPNIDLDLIPEHLHDIVNKNSVSDEQSGNHKGGNESETN